MKIFIIAALAMVALVRADEEAIKKRIEDFKANRVEKWNSMTEEERKEHMANRPHRPEIPEEVRQKIKEKFESLSPEERQKLREEHFAKLPHRPPHQFKDIPEEIRQKMKEKFESLSPETRQKIHDHIHRRVADVPTPYGENGKKWNFENLSEEKKQMIREKLEKLTPEQREELRKFERHQRIPAIIGPVPAAADGDFQKIRNRDDDVMLRKRLMEPQNNRRPPRFPALPAGDFQKIRSREDDIMVNDKMTLEFKHDRRPPRIPSADGEFQRIQPIADRDFERRPREDREFMRNPTGDRDFPRRPTNDRDWPRRPREELEKLRAEKQKQE